jgi:hypothetical protein
LVPFGVVKVSWHYKCQNNSKVCVPAINLRFI